MAISGQVQAEEGSVSETGGYQHKHWFVKLANATQTMLVQVLLRILLLYIFACALFPVRATSTSFSSIFIYRYDTHAWMNYENMQFPGKSVLPTHTHTYIYIHVCVQGRKYGVCHTGGGGAIMPKTSL